MRYNKSKRAVVRPSSVEVYFMPRDNGAKMLIHRFEKATSEILVAQYSFTHPPAIHETCEVFKKGCHRPGSS